MAFFSSSDESQQLLPGIKDDLSDYHDKKTAAQGLVIDHIKFKIINPFGFFFIS